MEITAVFLELMGMASTPEKESYDLHMLVLDLLLLVPALLLGKYLLRARSVIPHPQCCGDAAEEEAHANSKKCSSGDILEDQDDDASTDAGEAGTDTSSVADDDSAAEEEPGSARAAAPPTATATAAPSPTTTTTSAKLRGTQPHHPLKELASQYQLDGICCGSWQRESVLPQPQPRPAAAAAAAPTNGTLEEQPTKEKVYWEKPRVRLEKRLQVLSNTMAKLLRHTAKEFGLELENDGFVEVNALLKLKPLQDYKLEDLEAVVAHEALHGKGRFSLRKDSEDSSRVRVRANQGHSIQGLQDEALLDLADPEKLPKTLLHGTSEKSWEEIAGSGGLRAMGRSHIHLAAPGAGGVGGLLRKNVEVKIFVDTRQALARGVEFFQSENGVLLSRGLPDRHPQAGLLPLDCCGKVVRVADNVALWPLADATTTTSGLSGLQAVCQKETQQQQQQQQKSQTRKQNGHAAPRRPPEWSSKDNYPKKEGR